MNRFALLALVALAGCQATGSPTMPTKTQLQTDAALVTPALDVIVPALLNKPGISAADVQTVTLSAAAIKAAADRIAASGDSAVTAQSLVDGIRALAPVAIKDLAKSSYEAGLMQAAVDLTPLILQAAGIALPMASPDAPARESRAVATLQEVKK